MMKSRTGKECKKVNCKNYKYYSNWGMSMGQSALTECRNCKHAYVSQYSKEDKITSP
jgi:hypothetical protein